MIGLLTIYQYPPCGGFQLELSNIPGYGINEMKATQELKETIEGAA